MYHVTQATADWPEIGTTAKAGICRLASGPQGGRGWEPCPVGTLRTYSD